MSGSHAAVGSSNGVHSTLGSSTVGHGTYGSSTGGKITSESFGGLHGSYGSSSGLGATYGAAFGATHEGPLSSSIGAPGRVNTNEPSSGSKTENRPTDSPRDAGGFSNFWKDTWNKFTDWSSGAAKTIAAEARELGEEIAASARKVTQGWGEDLQGAWSSMGDGARYCATFISTTAPENSSEILRKLQHEVQKGSEAVIQLLQNVGDKVAAWRGEQEVAVRAGSAGDIPNFFQKKDVAAAVDRLVAEGVLRPDEGEVMKGGAFTTRTKEEGAGHRKINFIH